MMYWEIVSAEYETAKEQVETATKYFCACGLVDYN